MRHQIKLVFLFLLSSLQLPGQLPGDDCSNPIVLCQGGGIPVSTTGYTPDPALGTGFCGSFAIHNNSWVQFIAGNPVVSITVSVTNCLFTNTAGGGIQLAFYDFNGICYDQFHSELACDGQVQLGQSSTISFNANMGCTYLLMIDGYAGDQCDFTVSVQGIEADPLPPTFPDFNGCTSVFEGDIVTYNVQTPEQCLLYNMYTDPPIASAPGTELTVNYTGFVGNVQVCAVASHTCNATTNCLDVTVLPKPDFMLSDFIACNDDGFGQPILPLNLNDIADQLIANIPAGATLNWSQSPIITSPGTYVYSVLVITADGCATFNPPGTITVTIEDPQMMVTLEPDPLCEGDCIDLSTVVNITELSGLNNYSISFYPDAFSAAAGLSPILPPEAKYDDGIDPYWIRLESTNGCFDIEPISLYFEQVPLIQVEPVDTICGSYPISFDLQDVTIQDLTNLPFIEYHFYNDLITAESFPDNYLLSTVVQFYGPGTYLYYVRAVNENGNCPSDVHEIEIVISTGSTATISGSGDACENETVPLHFVFDGQAPFDVTVNDNHGNVYLFSSLTPNFTDSVTVNNTGLCSFFISNFIDGQLTDCPPAWFDTVFLNVHPLPTGTITGDTTICPASCANIALELSGSPPFTIVYYDSELATRVTLPNLSPTATFSVCPTIPATYTLISIQDSLGCYDTLSTSVFVDLHDVPIVSALEEICAGFVYTVHFEVSGGNPPYFVHGDSGTFVGNQFASDSIPVMTPYIFFVTDSLGCDSIQISGIVDTCCATLAGTMTSNATVDACVGDTVVVFHDGNENLDSNDVFTYILHTNPGGILGTVLATNNQPIFSFLPGVTQPTITYYISAIASNDDGTGFPDTLDLCLSVSPGTPVVWWELPTASLTENDSICIGESSVLTFEFQGIAPFTFVYSDGLTEDTLTTTDPSFELIVTPDSSTTYTLLQIEDAFCEGLIANAQIEIIVHQLPRAENLNVQCNNINTEFTFSFDIVEGTGPFTLLAGNGLISGRIFTSSAYPSGDTATIEFVDIYGCDTIKLDYDFTCSCSTESGSMNPDTLFACVDEQIIANHNADEVLDGNDVLQFVLHRRPDTIIGPNTILDTNVIPSFAFIPGLMTVGQVYYISALAGNNLSGNVDQSDPCLSLSIGSPVWFYDLPQIDISSDVTICENDQVRLEVDFIGTPPFTFVYSENDVVQPDITTTNNPYFLTVSPMDSTVYRVISITDLNCDDTVSNHVVVTVLHPPSYHNLQLVCDPLGSLTYEATFDLSGGSGTYILIDGPGSIIGDQYSSGPLPSQHRDTIFFTDQNACDTFSVEIHEDCACLTAAGSMSTDSLFYCADEFSFGPEHLGGAFLDFNDNQMFLLHNGSANSVGNAIIDTNFVPVFLFNSTTMNYGQTYFISSVVGNNNSGYVDLTDTCLAITNGTPVTWYPFPVARIESAPSSELTCDYPVVRLIGQNSTGFNSICYTWLDLSGNILGNDDSLDVGAAGFYQLVVEDQAIGCTDTSEIEVTNNIVFPIVEIEAPEVITCFKPAVQLNATGSSTGATIALIWTHENNAITDNNLSPFVNAPGTYTLTLTDTTNGCSTAQSVEVMSDTIPPIAEAGLPEVFTCETSYVFLDGSASSHGSVFQYQWTVSNGSTISDDRSLNPQVFDVGVYYLQVTDVNNGCNATDSVEITIENGIPGLNYTVDSISCYASADGEIIIDSISNGTSPFLLSINDSPFTAFASYVNLDVGTYRIILLDAGGCRDTIDVDLINPQELTVDLGPDEEINWGDSIQLQPWLSIPVDTLIWSNNTGLPTASGYMPFVLPYTSTQFSLTAINENGCSSTDRIMIIVDKTLPVYIPNSFSPNGDGLNERFAIYGDETLINQVNFFQIFSRWGELLYEAKDFQVNNETSGWNGSFRNEAMNSGIYIYHTEVAFIDGSVGQYKGDVALVR